MSEVVIATLNVNFQADTTAVSGVLKLEVDDRPEGLNSGDTSFSPGDDVYFFLFKDTNVTLVTQIPKQTAGGVTSAGSGTKVIEDDYVTFSNSDTASLDYPPDGSVTMQWVGSSYTLNGSVLTPNTTLPEVIGSELRMANGRKVLGVLSCSYSSTGSLWKLSGVPLDIPEVLIFAVGTAT